MFILLQSLELLSRCNCGSCKLEHVDNAKECKCCTEIPQCMDALQDKWVIETGEELLCITQHPGFRAVCLERWSLKLAADKYKTLENKRYKNTGEEKRYGNNFKLYLYFFSDWVNKIIL